jgi:excisionase family DNA binding protein
MRIGTAGKLSQEANTMQNKTGEGGGHNGHPAHPPLMDIEAVAQRLAVGVRHVRRLVTEKRIPYRKWGHLLRFEPDEIEAWIEASRVPAGPRRGTP